jgi:reductive dehalogenase
MGAEDRGGGSRVDERDTIFARMARQAGTPAHDDYYARRPQLKATDDHLRSLPRLMTPGGRHYDSVACAEAERHFRAIEAIRVDPRLVERWRQRLEVGSDPTAVLKGLVLELGGAAVGCAPVDPAFVYTHKGRFDADYGRPVDLRHASAIVFLVEMDQRAMRQAPRAPVLRESARQYFRAAEIAQALAAVIRAGGHDARPHYDAHYDVILPPLAVAAGLGELGRHNILIADRFGTRVRIGAVTTDLPVRHDEPVSLGVARFCEVCLKCADNCPSRALSAGEREQVRGVSKWPTHVERCHGYWRSVGTDCGVCMAVCPFSHADTAFHNAVRRVVRRAPWLARLAVWGDDLVYGRRWRSGRPSEGER